MSESSARVGLWNRHFLAGFWALFGCACQALLLKEAIRSSKVAWIPVVVGLAFLISAWGFYRGQRWGRAAIGFLVAPLALYFFDQLMSLHFLRYHGIYFWFCCFLLVAAFYTWLFLFSGLDRDASAAESAGDEFERH
jgi:hypothetical protein